MKCLIPVLALLCLLVLETQACCKNKKVGQCCGNGKCNIFCCNCNGGCNQRCRTDWDSFIGAAGAAVAIGSAVGRKKREVDETIAYFSKIDADSDGMISLAEASAYLDQHAVVRRDVAGVNPKWFTDIDINGDGQISPAEFDSKLA